MPFRFIPRSRPPLSSPNPPTYSSGKGGFVMIIEKSFAQFI
jgi:hypothetical protein